MSGSDQNLDLDGEMMGQMVGWIGEDGICWEPARDRPWHEADEDYCDPHLQGFLLRAMMVWYQYTGDPGWKGLMDRVVAGMDQMIVHREDYAYFPPMRRTPGKRGQCSCSRAYIPLPWLSGMP